LFISLSFTIISTKELLDTICFFHSIVPTWYSSAKAMGVKKDKNIKKFS
jgi:hypothetical protein